jgi:hypothetical protein
MKVLGDEETHKLRGDMESFVVFLMQDKHKLKHRFSLDIGGILGGHKHITFFDISQDMQTIFLVYLQMESKPVVYSFFFSQQKHYCLKVSKTYLLFALQFVFDLFAKNGQQNGPTLWQPENFRIDQILDANHFRLTQSTSRYCGDYRHQHFAEMTTEFFATFSIISNMNCQPQFHWVIHLQQISSDHVQTL